MTTRSFVGRRTEVDFLNARYEEAKAGRGSIVIVAGEAGIGKSRLVAQACTTFMADGARCLSGACFVYARSPLGPVRDLVASILRSEPELVSDAPALRHALRRLLGDGVGFHDDSGGIDESPRQYDALLEVVRRFSQARPTVLVLEDLHHADLATLECLHYAAMTLAQSRTLLLVTLRTNEYGGDPLTSATLARFERAASVWRLELEALAVGEVTQLVHDIVPRDRPLPPPRLRRILELSEGNPFFTEELVRQSVTVTDGELPSTIRAIVADRLHSLAERERRVLRACAVIGRRFEAGFVASLTGEPLTTVFEAIRRARDLHILRENREPPGAFEFRHALFRETLYAELLSAEVQPLHARIAELIDVQGDPSRINELAYHAWAAGDVERAVRSNEEAGDRALRLYADADAMVSYERALDFATEPSRRAQIDEKLGIALGYAGFPERGRQCAERALRFYEESGNAQKVAELALRIAYNYLNERKSSDWREWTKRALAAARSAHSDGLQHAAYLQLAQSSLVCGDPAKSEEYFADAERYAHAAGTVDRIRFFDLRALLYFAYGDARRCFDAYEGEIRTARDAGDLRLHARGLNNLGFAAIAFGDMSVAYEKSLASVNLSREGFLRRAELAALTTRAEVLLAFGAFEEARVEVDRAEAVARGIDSPIQQATLAAAAIGIATRLGDEGLLARYDPELLLNFAFSSEDTALVLIVAAMLAELFASRGDESRAERLIHRAVNQSNDTIRVPNFALASALYGAPADRARARELFARWACSPGNPAGEDYLTLFDANARRAGRGEVAEAQLRLQRRHLSGLVGVAMPAWGKKNASRAKGKRRERLTERETSIARLVADGKSNRAIAQQLSISERTVETHVASIFNKFSVRSRLELARAVLTTSIV